MVTHFVVDAKAIRGQTNLSKIYQDYLKSIEKKNKIEKPGVPPLTDTEILALRKLLAKKKPPNKTPTPKKAIPKANISKPSPKKDDLDIETNEW